MRRKKTLKYFLGRGLLFLLVCIIPLIVPGLPLNGMALNERGPMERSDRAAENDFRDHQKPENLGIHLYFATRDNAYLTAEQRGFVQPAGTVKLGELIIETLINGPRKELMPTLPAETVLKALYVGSDGTAYVDFSENLRRHHPGGAQLERLTIFSIVNSLILNIPEISAVKILIGGKESQTLAGHIDLRFPLKANMLLIR